MKEERDGKAGGRRGLLAWTLVSTALVELVTVWVRFRGGVTAEEFNPTAPFILRIHHLFWSLPLFAAAAIVRSRPPVRRALLGVAFGLIASDLLHHFAVLPVMVGNTGWHWP